MTERSFTGVGFFADLQVAASDPASAHVPARLVISDVEVSIEGTMHGVAIVLLVERGALAMLEGATYDEPWPEVLGAYSFRYHDPSRAALFETLRRIE